MSEHPISEIVRSEEYQIKDALADAVMVAYKQLMDKGYEEFVYKVGDEEFEGFRSFHELLESVEENHLTAEDLLIAETYHQCYEASMRAAYYLGIEKSELFSELFILNGRMSEDSPRNNDYRQHYVTCAKGVDGRYYAISPANYRLSEYFDDEHLKPIIDNKFRSIEELASVKEGLGEYNSDEEHMLEIIEADNLEDLVVQIQNLEGGVWPTLESIEDRDLSISKGEKTLGGQEVETVNFPVIRMGEIPKTAILYATSHPGDYKKHLYMTEVSED